MKPMKPMDAGPKWWPEDLGEPGTSGSQNDVRYAFFPGSHRLAIQQDGKLAVYRQRRSSNQRCFAAAGRQPFTRVYQPEG